MKKTDDKNGEAANTAKPDLTASTSSAAEDLLVEAVASPKGGLKTDDAGDVGLVTHVTALVCCLFNL